MNDVLTPAATDKSNVSGETWDAISVKTPGRTCGFTARTTTSETRATSPLDASASTPRFVHRAARAASELRETRMEDGETAPDSANPRAIASAIDPAPMNPTVPSARGGGGVDDDARATTAISRCRQRPATPGKTRDAARRPPPR